MVVRPYIALLEQVKSMSFICSYVTVLMSIPKTTTATLLYSKLYLVDIWTACFYSKDLGLT